jgi:uncharacterized RDD family membrane protein YckC
MKTVISIIRRLNWLVLLGLALHLPPSLCAQAATGGLKTESDRPAIEAEIESGRVVLKRDALTRSRMGPRVAVGHDIRVEDGEIVEQVVVVRGEATVDGEVEGDVVVILGKASINNRVHGEVVGVLSNVELGSKAEVDGDAVTVGGTLNKRPGATVHGESPQIRLPSFVPDYNWLERNVFKGFLLRPFPSNLRWTWIAALAFFAIHLLILLIMPVPVQRCAETLVESPLRCLLVGILAYVLFFPLMVILSWTIIGVPILICALIAAAMVGKVVVYRVSGGQIGRQLHLGFLQQPLGGFCLGTVLFYLLYMIPIFGWVVWFLITPLGVGTVVCTALSSLQRERTKAPAQPLGAVYPPPAGVPPAGPATANLMGAPSDGLGTSAAALGGGGTVSLAAQAVPPVISAVTNRGLSSIELASLPRVGFWPRFAAGVLDVVLVAIVSGLIVGGSALFLFLLAAYLIGMWTWRGTTLGGALLGLKVVRADGLAVDLKVALVRAIGCFVSVLPCGLGFFWASWTPERLAWHDIIAGTVMVKMPKPISLV